MLMDPKDQESRPSPLAYWKERLRGASVVELATDKPRSAAHGAETQQSLAQIPAAVCAALKSFCEEKGVSLFTLLLAAYQVLLYRYTANEDIVVAVPAIGNAPQGIAFPDQITDNLLLIRGDLSNNISFRHLVTEIKDVVEGAFNHQNATLFEIYQDIRQDEGFDKFLHQLMFSLQADGTPSPTLPSDIADPTFDLALRISPSNDQWMCHWKYRTDLFHTSTIEKMAKHFLVLLENLLKHPGDPIASISLLDPIEREEILHRWNKTEVDYRHAHSLHQLFEEQVDRTPDQVAVVYEDTQLTYRELNEKANQLAHYLKKQKITADTLVGLCIERSLEMVVGIFGTLKAGGAYVPIDPGYPADRIAYMIEDSRAPWILTQQRLQGSLTDHPAKVLCLDTDWHLVSEEPKENPQNQTKLSDLAYVIYTSGSTGKPKGAMLPHRGIVNHMLWMKDVFPLGSHDSVLQKTPFSFDASVWEFYAALIQGGRLVMAKPGGHHDAEYLVETIKKEKITTLQLVPTLLRILLETGKMSEATSLTRVYCGGEALTLDLQKMAFAQLSAKLYNLYGPTECTIDSTYFECKQDSLLSTVPIGGPVANTQLYVLDPQLNPVPAGVPGELHIGGAGLARGYLNRPELTAEKFIPNPFSQDPADRMYKTGDQVRYLQDGMVEYISRIDHQVKLRGFRIELGEIESLLATHPTVRQNIVLVRQDPAGDQRLVAYIVPTKEEQPEPGKLRKYLRDELPEYMVPSLFIFLDNMPLTPNGKIDRNALPSIESQKDKLAVQHDRVMIGPRDQWERTLLEIWEDILGISPLSVTDHLFSELGASSLAAMRAVNEIREVLQKNIQAEILLQEETVERQALLLKKNDDQVGSTLVTLKSKGDKPPIFLVHAAGGSAFHYTALARAMGNDRPVHVLQDPAYFSDVKLQDSIEDMATEYLKAIRDVQTSGPYYVGGWSLGGKVAFEMANQLIAAGEEVPLLLMFDTGAPVNAFARIMAKIRKQMTKTALMLLHRFPNLAKKLGIDPKKVPQVIRLNALAYLDMDENLPSMISFIFPGAFDPSQFKGMSTDEIWEQVFLTVKDQEPGLVVPGFDAASTRRTSKLFAKHHEVDNKYVPKWLFPGAITMLMVRGTDKSMWNRFCKTPMQIFEYDVTATERIGDPHNAMMERENVALFLKDFVAILNAADQQSKKVR